MLSPPPKNLLGWAVRLVGLFVKDSLVKRRGLVGDEGGLLVVRGGLVGDEEGLVGGRGS